MIKLHDKYYIKDCIKALFVPYINQQGGDSITPVLYDAFRATQLRSVTERIKDVIKVGL